MSTSRSHILRLPGSGAAELLPPTGFAGRIDERQLEDLLVSSPELAGGELLILERRLREFEEDSDRLAPAAATCRSLVADLKHPRDLRDRLRRRPDQSAR